MTKKEDALRKVTPKAIVYRVAAATRTAKKSVKAVLMTKRTLPPPVEIEPRRFDSPILPALRKEHQRLLDEIQHQEIPFQDHPTTGTHMADDASDVAEQATTLALRRNLDDLLKEVERAILRAERGTYGLCERCGLRISEERLQVMPAAMLCIVCAKLQNPHAR
jgi:RNA polymerase-binding protein DksA